MSKQKLEVLTPQNSQLIFIDHQPQDVVYRRLRGAAAGLLVSGSDTQWWTNFAKMVDYIALGIPVVAEVSPHSEARRELEKAGTSRI